MSTSKEVKAKPSPAPVDIAAYAKYIENFNSGVNFGQAPMSLEDFLSQQKIKNDPVMNKLLAFLYDREIK